MRMDKTKRVVLNAPVLEGMDYQVKDEKFLRFGSLDLQGKAAAFLLRVRSLACLLYLTRLSLTLSSRTRRTQKP